MRKKDSKKNLLYGIFFSLYWSIFVAAQTNQAITYFWGGGRFGDKIVSYTTAKWISFKFNIPLFLKPFQYSSMLRLGREKKYSKKIVEQFERVVPIESGQDIIEHNQENVIFESRGGHFRIDGCSGLWQTIEYMLRDQSFIAELKNMLQPIVSLPTITLPQNKVTVAVHVRKGGGFDQPLNSIQYYGKSMVTRKFYADERWPFKFPPEQYYVDQIKKISKLFDDSSLFVYIFTDDRSPLKLVERIKKAVNKPNITFSCRGRGNAHNVHVIEDFYNMARFDCFVRSSSNFAIAAQLLGNHKVVIYPKHWQWVGKKLVIDEVSIVDYRVSCLPIFSCIDRIAHISKL